jgi:hypothetical protein
MVVAYGQINAKAVPGLGVAVLEVVTEAGAEVRGEAYVIKLCPPVEGVNAVALADVLADDVLVFFECLAGDVFEVLTD